MKIEIKCFLNKTAKEIQLKDFFKHTYLQLYITYLSDAISSRSLCFWIQDEIYENNLFSFLNIQFIVGLVSNLYAHSRL